MKTKEELLQLNFEMIQSELEVLKTTIEELEEIAKDKKCNEENYWMLCSIIEDLGIIKDKILTRIFNSLKRGDFGY